ncbi:MAG: hypothetical protein ACE5ES_03675 [Candidatus Nanoarchaeia archaeon]
MKKLVIIIFLSIILTSFVSADFGVASQYYEGRPLEINPGETVNTYFKIQNTVGETSDMVVEPILLNGSEISSFTSGTTYNIPAGEQVTANLEIKVPDNVKIGTEYTINVLFKPTSTPSEEGTVQFVVNINKRFQVVVGEAKEERKTSSNLVWIGLTIIIFILILLVLALIIYIVKRNRSQENLQIQNTNP